MMCRFLFLFLTILFSCSNGIESVNISRPSASAASNRYPPHFEDFSGGNLAQALDEAIYSNDDKELLDLTSGRLSEALGEAIDDDPTWKRDRSTPKLVNRYFDDKEPLVDLTGGGLEAQLNDAINDDEGLKSTQPKPRLINSDLNRQDSGLDFAGRMRENQLAEAINDEEERLRGSLTSEQLQDMYEASRDERDSPFYPRRASPDAPSLSGFERLSMSSSMDSNEQDHDIVVDRMPDGQIPPGIAIIDYEPTDAADFARLFRGGSPTELHELFLRMSRQIHLRFLGCVKNVANWLLRRNTMGPIMMRNCVPCANAVDLNLKNLMDHAVGVHELKQHFVETCDQGTRWVSYITNLVPLPIDFRRHPTTTFTEAVRQNLLPNHR